MGFKRNRDISPTIVVVFHRPLHKSAKLKALDLREINCGGGLLLFQSNAPQQILEARIAAQLIVRRVYFD